MSLTDRREAFESWVSKHCEPFTNYAMWCAAWDAAIAAAAQGQEPEPRWNEEDALLRQALEAMERFAKLDLSAPIGGIVHEDFGMDVLRARAIDAAIRKHFGEKS